MAWTVKGGARTGAAALLAAGLALTLTGGGRADEGKAAGPFGERKAVATSTGADGTLLRQETAGGPWKAVAEGEAVHTGDLLIGLPGAGLRTRDGSATVRLVEDLEQRSPMPLVETALRLKDDPGMDLGIVLERGRVDVTNARPSGPFRFRLHAWDRTGDIELTRPGSSVALMLASRWAKGVPFKKNAAAKHRPEAHFLALVLKGEAMIKGQRNTYKMQAPPGPALLHVATTDEADPAPMTLTELPSWAEPANTARSEHLRGEFQALRQKIMLTSLDEALREGLASDDPDLRGVALVLAGATDRLPLVGEAIRADKNPDVFERGVRLLRHWIGRGPGQDQKLYEGLMKNGMKPAHAEALVQLLHSFSDQDLAQPETYEALITYLDHPEPAVRGAAYWHLMRLIPEGRSINYSFHGTPEQRAQAIQKWKELWKQVQARGKLPPERKGGDQ